MQRNKFIKVMNKTLKLLEDSRYDYMHRGVCACISTAFCLEARDRYDKDKEFECQDDLCRVFQQRGHEYWGGNRKEECNLFFRATFLMLFIEVALEEKLYLRY